MNINLGCTNTDINLIGKHFTQWARDARAMAEECRQMGQEPMWVILPANLNALRNELTRIGLSS